MKPRRPSPPLASFALGVWLCACGVDTHGTIYNPPPEAVSSASSSSVSGTGGAAGAGGGQGGAAGAGGQGGMMPPGPGCGNGIIEGTEQCDDNNTAAADGCSSDCKNEDPNVCNGVTIKMNKGDVVTTNGDTTNASDKSSKVPKIEYCSGSSVAGSDLVYAVVPQVNGTLVATLDAAYGNHWLHIHKDCPGTESKAVGCDYGANSSTNDVSTVQVTAGTTYYVFCDGYEGGQGSFSLTLELQ